VKRRVTVAVLLKGTVSDYSVAKIEIGAKSRPEML
jgi:hypothetical protein